MLIRSQNKEGLIDAAFILQDNTRIAVLSLEYTLIKKRQ